MESTFLFDSQIMSCVLLPSDMPMASTFEKKCFLCDMKEFNGNCLVGSQESSLLLCKILNVPHLMNDLKKLENINYCDPCKKRILKIHESLEILKKLEKEVFEEKCFLRLQLEINHKVADDEMQYSPWDFRVELVNEIKYKSINSKLKRAVKNQIDRKFISKRNNYRIMKNITITINQKLGTFEEHISKETTPPICNIISTEKQTFINDNLSFPSNSHFVDSVTNSPFNHAEMPLTSHVYDFDEIKLELLSGETNNITDIKDPFDGIVPEPDPTPQNIFVCGTCETNFDDYSQLDEHFCTHIGSKSMSFDPNEFVSKVSSNTKFYSHVKNFVNCRYCVEVFPDHFSLYQHERIHTAEKPVKCRYCEKSFRHRMYLKSHERIHTNKKHKRIHTNEKLFKCGYCDKTFRDPSNAKSHENIHKEKEPFKCKFCGKCFSQKANMERHERIHTKEKPFKCKFCGKSFSQKSIMEIHARIHSKEKPFKCEFCGKGYTQNASVKRHERIHTNEKPFNCGYCDKTFGDPSNLKSHHEYIHKEKPFKCTFCEKSFSQKPNMERHERIHTNENPFKCKFCGKYFVFRETLISHKCIHTVE